MESQGQVVGRKGWNHRGRWLGIGGRGGITEEGGWEEGVESQRKVVGRKGWNRRGRHGTGRGRMREAGGEEGMESEDSGWEEGVGSQRQEWKR